MVNRAAILPLLALLSCASQEPPLPEMEPVELLTRVSLDLRGVRPSTEEIERVEADPEAIEELIDTYMDDPRFGTRVRDLYAEIYLTRADVTFLNADDLDVDATQAEFSRSVGDEPLRMLERIAVEDLPYTDLVTADWTMANEVTAQVWPLDYPAGETGWRVAHYTDNRPAAGVLATNSMWWRYVSTDSNANRKRANAASRILLCNDYLTRPIDFDRNINLLDEEAVEDALRTNPSCMNCHVSLDPLASYFYGFQFIEGSAEDASRYHPERERNWRYYQDTPPGYYGEPGYNLTDLGHQIAADNRFPECAVEQATELFLRRDAALMDDDELTRHREAFLEGGLVMRDLFRSVLSSPYYRAGTTDDAGTVSKKMVTPDLLGTQFEGLTGFSWENEEGANLLQTEMGGFRTLAGGADGYFVTDNATAPNPTLLLVQQRLAEASAYHVVAHDITRPGDAATLLGELDWTETPETNRAAMVAQLQALHLSLYGNRIAPDGPEVEANLALWSELYAVEGTTRMAWTGLLSALLRDPDMLFY